LYQPSNIVYQEKNGSYQLCKKQPDNNGKYGASEKLGLVLELEIGENKQYKYRNNRYSPVGSKDDRSRFTGG
jgi:hypothetical protein